MQQRKNATMLKNPTTVDNTVCSNLQRHDAFHKCKNKLYELYNVYKDHIRCIFVFKNKRICKNIFL
jgi:hypothetical protein